MVWPTGAAAWAETVTTTVVNTRNKILVAFDKNRPPLPVAFVIAVSLLLSKIDLEAVVNTPKEFCAKAQVATEEPWDQSPLVSEDETLILGDSGQ
jgi:hypothetical protein